MPGVADLPNDVVFEISKQSDLRSTVCFLRVRLLPVAPAEILADG